MSGLPCLSCGSSKRSRNPARTTAASRCLAQSRVAAKAMASVSARRCRGLHDRVAAIAGAPLGARVEALEERRQLLFDVLERDEFLEQQIPATLAVPLKAVELAGAPLAFNDESHGIGATLW